MTWKRWTAVGAAAATLALVPGCDLTDIDGDVANTDYEATAAFSDVVDGAGITRLTLRGINGRVDLTGSSDGSTIRIEGERIVRSESHADAVEHLDRLQVQITVRGSEVVVETDQPNRTHGRQYVVEYALSVPESLVSDLTTTNGEIRVAGMTATPRLASVNGAALLTDHGAGARVDVVNGSIEVEVVAPGAGPFDLSTVNGSIDLIAPPDASLDLRAQVVNGSIEVSGFDLWNVVSTRTSLSCLIGSGDARTDLETVNGSIRVRAF